MKKFTIIAFVLFFSTVTLTDIFAQGRGNGKNSRKERKEYVKYIEKRQKDARKYAKKQDKAYHKYYEKREKEYRKYVKNQRKQYRDHDSWYYGERFHHRPDYVYFPKYRTYYDPYRRGYIYRRNNAWIFDHTMPGVMVGVNLGRLNVQFMADLPL
ncbi:hypothetical protein [Sphingobacterium gobiense]|uniref:Uncharacterized protein n=1 Tax=Sphingobacterium gobiense TaxID=1382456 RepID=A0A2S9JVA5_9SPHI|nr:hypothetical protein [Sphingobacterium gobiense]PRD57214.1 hypothetical protein C5749_08435 [Sphingobacterium gobiense]